MKRKVVEVEWFDAQSSLQTMDMEELEKLKPLMTFSVGYLLIEKLIILLLGSWILGKD